MKRIFLLFIVFLQLEANGQNFVNPFKENPFVFPIKPGVQNFLTGSMGELRPNHFHSGIDIKTDYQIGLPVYCSESGYVSRIKTSTYGYGKVIYISHDNGYSTVYAHLDHFNDSLQAFMLKKQYENKSFELDYYPNPGSIKVKKGEIIAYSGNTGSSGGPHLHYEIRDKDEKVWNPLLFGFKEIQDNIKPGFDYLAVRTFRPDARVEKQFGRAEFTVKKVGDAYTIDKPIEAFGLIGIETKVFDKMSGIENRFGINCLEVKVNDKEVFYHNITSFSFEEIKKVNAHIDYETLISKNVRFQKCYIGDGSKLSSYKTFEKNGLINIEANQSYKIEITIYDSYNNTSKLIFYINGKEPIKHIQLDKAPNKSYRIFENHIKIISGTTKDTTCTFYSKNNKIAVSPSYYINKQPVYIYDLRKALPDSSEADKYKIKFDFHSALYPGKSNEIVFDDFKIRFSDTSLIDTLYLQLKCTKDKDGWHCVDLHNALTPLFGKVEIIYNNDSIDNIHPKTYWSLNGRKHESSTIQEKGIRGEMKYLGKFKLTKDTLPPSIKYISHGSGTIRFNISDGHSGIQTFNAWLNDEWILMHYEHKKSLIWAERLDKTKPLKGNFVLEVVDKVGNKKIFKQTL